MHTALIRTLPALQAAREAGRSDPGAVAACPLLLYIILLVQEVEQHLEDDHVDKGDTQRSIAFYKEMAAEAARARRQRELELEVTGSTLGQHYS